MTHASSLACEWEGCGSTPSSVASRDHNDSTGDNPTPSDFIRDIVAEDVRTGKHTADSHPLSARAEWLSAHRPRQVDLPEFRHRARIRRHLQHAHGRHQSDQGRSRVRRFHHGGREMADRRLGATRISRKLAGAPVLRLRLFRSDLRLRGGARSRKAKPTSDDMTPEETDEYRRLGKESPFRNRSDRGKSRSVRAHEGRRISGRRAHACARRST